MTDLLQPANADPLTIVKSNETVQKTATPLAQSNLMQNHKRLSLIGQIYNFQPTGVTVVIHTPLANTDNTPILMLAASPDWNGLGSFYRKNDATSFKGKRITYWANQKPWVVPTSVPIVLTGGVNPLPFVPIGDGITIRETDDMPDISFWSQYALGWSGQIDYQLRVISNVTTQGKISVSRMYDVESIGTNLDPSKHRTPLPITASMSNRRKNGFFLFDLSRTEDVEIHMPYVSKMPYFNNQLSDANFYYALPPRSYAVLDALYELSSSAGASVFSFEILIRAGQDFQFHFPQYPSQEIYSQSVHYNSFHSHLPLVYGKDTNLIIDVAKDTLTINSV